jgi:hypothetical protein
MKPGGLSSNLQALVFNTFCLSKYTYAIEIMSVNNTTINFVNGMQKKFLEIFIANKRT